MQASEFEMHARVEDRHWWFCARREIIAAALASCGAQDGSQMLEVGCGTGGNLRYFRRKYRVEGIEVDAGAAALARQLSNCPIHTADILQSEPELSFDPDIVLMADVLEHVDDDRALLQAAFRLVREGGLLAITVPADPALWSAHDVALGHRRRYTQDSLGNLIASIPAHVLRVSHFNSLLYPPIRLARILRGRRESNRRHETASDLHDHSKLTNALLYRVFAFERRVLARRDFPFGCSLLTILRKEGA